MDKEQVKRYAKWILEGIEEGDRRIEDWAKGILKEIELLPHKIHERLERIERKLEGK